MGFIKSPKGLLLLGFLVILLIGVPLTVYLVQQQQNLRQEAWNSNQSATVACNLQGMVDITAQFTNSESQGSSNAMLVSIKDLQSGIEIDIGTINPGETKSATIATTQPSVAAGTVLFTLKWADGHGGTDSASASYPAVASCTNDQTGVTPGITDVPPTITPGVTTTIPTTTPTPTTATQITPSSSSTPTPTVSPTPMANELPTSTPIPTQIAQNPSIPPTGPTETILSIGVLGLLAIAFGGFILFVL